MNKVILMGRLTREPDIRVSGGGEENQLTIAHYTLAVNRRVKKSDNGNDQADFVPCVTFGKAAEVAEKYFRQGTKIVIAGRIQTGSYTNKDGQKVRTVEVVVEEQYFAGSNSSENRSSERNNNGDNEFMNIPEGETDGLPFN